MKNISLTSLIVLIVFLLNGCGGGGGGSTSATIISGAAIKVKNLNFDYQKNVVSNYAVGDLNGDGLDDVVIGGWSGGTNYITILIQNSDGTLSDRTLELLVSNQYPGSAHIIIVDFDHDGHADIWLPGADDWVASVPSVMLWGGTSGKFIRQTVDSGISSKGACIADLNQDGNIDLLVMGVYDQQVNTYGYYLNNGNRSFSPLVPNQYINGASACAVARDNGSKHFAILQAGTNQLLGYKDTISIVDSNLNLIKQIGLPPPISPANLAGITTALAVDVNGDDLLDFVITYESWSYGGVGRKDVWLNRGNDNFEFGFTIDLNPVVLDSSTFTFNQIIYINFNGGNLDNNLYQVINGQFIPYKKDRFLSLAKSVGAEPNATGGKSSIWSSVVYKGPDGLYILEDLRPIGLHTGKL